MFGFDDPFWGLLAKKTECCFYVSVVFVKDRIPEDLTGGVPQKATQHWIRMPGPPPKF